MQEHKCPLNPTSLKVIFQQELIQQRLIGRDGYSPAKREGWDLVKFNTIRNENPSCFPISFCPWCGAILRTPDVIVDEPRWPEIEPVTTQGACEALALAASTAFEKADAAVRDGIDQIIEGLQSQTQAVRTAMEASTMPIPWLPEYVAVRNRWHSIPTWLHWLFPRLRKRYEALLLEQQQVTLNAVIEWGEDRIAAKESDG